MSNQRPLSPLTRASVEGLHRPVHKMPKPLLLIQHILITGLVACYLSHERENVPYINCHSRIRMGLNERVTITIATNIEQRTHQHIEHRTRFIYRIPNITLHRSDTLHFTSYHQLNPAPGVDSLKFERKRAAAEYEGECARWLK